MENRLATYNTLLSRESMIGLDTEASLEHIGLLTDLSLDLRQTEGLTRAIRLSEELGMRQLTAGQAATLDYFVANAWSNLRVLSRAGKSRDVEWEQGEIEQEIIHLRRALQGDALGALPNERVCQILTNLANVLHHVGRFVEAIEYWDRALSRAPSFAMARGNRGRGLADFAGTLYDRGHTGLLLQFAYDDLRTALSGDIHEAARRAFDEYRVRIESLLPPEHLNKTLDLNAFSLGDSEEECRYRRWCAENRLFLNPLNDLGPYPIGARDILTTPSIVVGIREGPYYPGYFNQMKQEFVSARYLCYEGFQSRQPHFSDRGVFLFNTLDYPSYSLAVEKVKAAFRIAYSLLDKVAYFLNHYLSLGIAAHRVSFRTFWYCSQRKNEGLRRDLLQRINWPLRGLFWLSKDLYEDEPGFKESIEPEAQELAVLRNHLEHRYLKLHDEFWAGRPAATDSLSVALADTLSLSIYRRQFETKSLRLLKTVRAALMYLSLAVHWEEQERAKTRSPDAIVPGIPLDIWEDEWKV